MGDCCGFHVTERERERRREKKRKRSHGADDKNLARRAPCCTRHGGWRFPRRDENSISDQMKQMREQMQMRMDGIMQAQRERMQNLQMGSNPGANITVRSEVPLSVTTQMSSSSPNTQRSSVSSTSSGGTSTSSFQSVRTSTSSSFSSSSAGSGGASNGNATSSDRVALVIETPDAQLIFNVGPTLEKIGIKVDPLLDEKQAGGAEAEAEDEIPETSFTVKRVMIEDGADINKVGSSYPVLNLTIVSPIFNFN